MAASGANRPGRVGERIRQELGDILIAGAVKDPGVQGVVVHAVRVTGDLQQATVFVRLLSPSPTAEQQRGLLRGLARASGFLRREVGSRLSLRYTPELRFEWDETAERARNIEALLGELASERKAREPE